MMSTTLLLESMNQLSDVEFNSGHWWHLTPQLIAVNVTKKGLVSDGLILLNSSIAPQSRLPSNRKVAYFYFNLATKQYSLGR
jgi:hypothetical protein